MVLKKISTCQIFFSVLLTFLVELRLSISKLLSFNQMLHCFVQDTIYIAGNAEIISYMYTVPVCYLPPLKTTQDKIFLLKGPPLYRANDFELWKKNAQLLKMKLE